MLRCDNGPELACQAMADWAGGGVGLWFIPPGEPWRNGGAALRKLPPVGEDSSGPLGPGLLAAGILRTIIGELQAGLASTTS